MHVADRPLPEEHGDEGDDGDEVSDEESEMGRIDGIVDEIADGD